MTTTAAQPSDVCAITTTFDSPDESDYYAFTSHVVKLMMAGARAHGFWSVEIQSPSETFPDKWKLIERFRTTADASIWQNCAERKQLLTAFESLLKGKQIQIVDELNQTPNAEVSTAIITNVRPEMEEDYFKWVERIQIAQTRHPGYRSSYFQPPIPGRPHQWSTLIRFDNPSNLESWFESPVRKALLSESEEFVTQVKIHRVFDAFPGWIPADEKGNSPPNWKTAMLVLLGLFPVVMLEIMFVTPLLMSVEPTVRTFINLVGSVAATSFITMPFFVRNFKWWLYPSPSEKYSNQKGIGILIALFAIEVVIFILMEKK